MKRFLSAAAAVCLSTLLVAFGAASAPASPPATSAPATSAPAAAILISGFEYSGDLTVKTGQVVTVTNGDPSVPVPILHTLTDTQTAVPLFDTGPILPDGGTATFTAPALPGSYLFGCRFHLFMQGTLVVQP